MPGAETRAPGGVPLLDAMFDFFNAGWWSFGAIVLAGALVSVPAVGWPVALAVLVAAPLVAGRVQRSRRVGGLVAVLLGAVVAGLWAAFQRPIFWGL